MHRWLTSLAVLLTFGCGGQQLSVSGGETVSSEAGLSFEDFVAQYAFKEPGRDVYVADGDIAFKGLKQLREFYELHVRHGQLIVNRVGSADDKWDATRKLNLTYCISNEFGARKAQVVSSMAAATKSWMDAANVKFVYVAAQDANCTSSNNAVLFDVNPVNVRGEYLARAFFPSDSRWGRNILIDDSLFRDTAQEFIGVLRHELGHVLGFRHEHTRPEAGTCFEDSQFRALTPYDSSSVMHYPHCRGTNNWTLPLTALDKQGVAALYGPAQGATPVTPPGPVTRETQTAAVAKDVTKTFGPFTVRGDSTFHVAMTGTGDADLYVRVGSAPTAGSYDCRPYTSTSNEECTVTAGAASPVVYVSVVGYRDAQVSLSFEYEKVAAAPTPAPTPAGVAQRGTLTGSVAKNAEQRFPAIAVTPGSSFVVSMTGTNDPDLYVKFGEAPTTTAFDCRPFQTGPIETCTLTVPEGATTAHLMVAGFSATTSTFSLDVSWTGPQR